MKPPYATTLLSLSLLAAYFFLAGTSLYIPGPTMERLAFHLNNNPLSAVTHLFIHVGLQHLFGNLVPLIAFGIILELAISAMDLIALFIFAGVLSSALFALITPGAGLIGASAAISGMMGAAMLLKPKQTILLLLITPLLIYYAVYPATAAVYSVRLEQVNVEQKQLEVKVTQLIRENKTVEAKAANATLAQAQAAKTQIVEGKKTEEKTPSTITVHLIGAALGIIFVFGFKRRKNAEGMKEYDNAIGSALKILGRK
ncbi:rhomboid family intramembrane serine protease [Candidatus Micrarchaeota archaeon]|nr:rhomboid family intramembrane serine protease [Candidatus Micrarchaeota archaeon]